LRTDQHYTLYLTIFDNYSVGMREFMRWVWHYLHLRLWP